MNDEEFLGILMSTSDLWRRRMVREWDDA